MSVDPAPALPSSTPLAEMRDLLLDENAPIFLRYRAMFGLRNLGTEEAAGALGEAFRCRSALLKHEVAYVLGQLQQSSTVDVLRWAALPAVTCGVRWSRASQVPPAYRSCSPPSRSPGSALVVTCIQVWLTGAGGHMHAGPLDRRCWSHACRSPGSAQVVAYIPGPPPVCERVRACLPHLSQHPRKPLPEQVLCIFGCSENVSRCGEPTGKLM